MVIEKIARDARGVPIFSKGSRDPGITTTLKRITRLALIDTGFYTCVPYVYRHVSTASKQQKTNVAF